MTDPGNATRNTRKIVILGSRSVGKSSLLQQFIDESFSGAYCPTIESTATTRKTIRYNGVEYLCEIIEGDVQNEFTHFEHTILGVHGYVLVYSITSWSSFNMIQIIHDKILHYLGVSEIPAIIVGSKADLHMSRQVASKDGQQLAKQYKTAWIETHALLTRNENVGNVFELCLAEIEKRNARPSRREETRCIIM
ncbi:P-loop containing nucleoside triphosphate hydrolase protein [Mycena pura]|uniref:P-loop containing nucleoside triphosphate hydrolase protein n=1 Tax=Mycena pura TaxID=153505 RepID=A0AAD6XZG9_9AGAR|nr:P-loop containing nucleoside triphosphate hydrolase protein [Mycena pura]